MKSGSADTLRREDHSPGGPVSGASLLGPAPAAVAAVPTTRGPTGILAYTMGRKSGLPWDCPAARSADLGGTRYPPYLHLIVMHGFERLIRLAFGHADLVDLVGGLLHSLCVELADFACGLVS